MYRTKAEQQVGYRCIHEGIGEVKMEKILLGEEEMYGKGRMFNYMTILPGNTIGEHTHSGDNEIFYFLKGTGIYKDNGVEKRIQPGDTAICNDGDSHAVINDGDEPLEFVALILY